MRWLLWCVLVAVWSVEADAVEPPITAIAFAPNAKWVVTASQQGVRVRNWPDLKVVKAVDAFAANLHCLAFSPGGTMLAVGGGNPAEVGIVEVFTWPELRSVATVMEHQDSATTVRWLDDSKWFSAGLDRDVLLCDLQEESVVKKFSGHSRAVAGIALLPGKQFLVSAGDDQSVRVWNLASGQMIRSLNQHTKPIRAIAVRPRADGLPMVATAAADRTIRFWQPTIGRMVRYVRLPSEPLDIAWTPDGGLIAASCADGHVRVVDPAEVKVILDEATFDGWAYAIAMHPETRQCAIGGSAGQLKVVDLKFE